MDFQKQFSDLKEYIGEKNIQIDYFSSDEAEMSFTKIRITHLPSKKKYFGIDYETQIENAVDALKKLKEDIS